MTGADTGPEYVVVPAYPAVTGEQKDVRFELREGPSGAPVGVAFTTVEKLVRQLGRFQPWMVIKTDEYRELLAKTQVRTILLDPDVDTSTVHWSDEAITALTEVNDRGRL